MDALAVDLNDDGLGVPVEVKPMGWRITRCGNVQQVYSLRTNGVACESCRSHALIQHTPDGLGHSVSLSKLILRLAISFRMSKRMMMYQSSLLFPDVRVPIAGSVHVNVWTRTYTFSLSSRMICQVL
jgi:hypothetical protein